MLPSKESYKMHPLFKMAYDYLATHERFPALSLVLIALLLLVVVALSQTVFRGARLDLTENQLYTLSDGTRALLTRIDEPINLYFFYSRKVLQGSPLNVYAQRVRDLLDELVRVAGHNLRLTVIDPEPFSDAEDRAVQLGVQAVNLGGSEKLYFGLAATNAIGNTETIPFLQPSREDLLEYDIGKLLYKLNQVRKPVVGLMSTLDIQGGFDSRRMQPTRPWIAVEQLRELFDLRTLQTDIKEIPADVNLLVLVHPADLATTTQYAIDQFVLRGGRLVMFIDPFAETAAPSPMMQPGQVSATSNPSLLMNKWGIKMRPDVVGDSDNALQVTFDPRQGPIYHYAILALTNKSLDQNDVVTRNIESVNVAYAGILERISEAKTEFTPLLRSSTRAMPIPNARVRMANLNPASLQSGFTPTGESYVMAARIRGVVESAFPEGSPTASEPTTSSDTNPDPARHLKESKEPVNIIVIADTDMLTDQLWVRTQNFFGQMIATPWAGNGTLLVNAVDNLLGSDELISIKSRASYSRPFTRVENLRREADSQFRAKEQELQNRLRETEQKLSELQSRKDQGNALILSPEQQEALLRFQQDQIKIRKELRDVRHELNKNIDSLGNWLRFINIGLIPLLLILGVGGVRLIKRFIIPLLDKKSVAISKTPTTTGGTA